MQKNNGCLKTMIYNKQNSIRKSILEMVKEIKMNSNIGLDKQINLIKDKHERFRPIKINIEGNAYQKVLAKFFIDRTDIPVHAEFHNLDSESRALKLQPMLENKKFFIRSSMQYVIEEFTGFEKGRPNDVIDSIVLAEEASTDSTGFSGYDEWD